MKKENRLKRNHEIAAVVKNKKRVCGECYNLYYQKNSQKAKVAFSVSKKFGTAVERNYAKRVARELMRGHYLYLPKLNIVLVIKAPSKFKSFLDKKNDLEKIMEILKRKELNKNEKQ